MRGLVALKTIEENCDLFDEGYKWDKEFSSLFTKCFDIIEKQLKDYEQYEAQDIKVCGGSFLTCKSDFATLWKEHKALEIIKNKREVWFDYLFRVESYEEYNKTLLSYYEYDKETASEYYLTQEEFDLLKEVFQDGKE